MLQSLGKAEHSLLKIKAAADALKRGLKLSFFTYFSHIVT